MNLRRNFILHKDFLNSFVDRILDLDIKPIKFAYHKIITYDSSDNDVLYVLDYNVDFIRNAYLVQFIPLSSYSKMHADNRFFILDETIETYIIKRFPYIIENMKDFCREIVLNEYASEFNKLNLYKEDEIWASAAYIHLDIGLSGGNFYLYPNERISLIHNRDAYSEFKNELDFIASIGSQEILFDFIKRFR